MLELYQCCLNIIERRLSTAYFKCEQLDKLFASSVEHCLWKWTWKWSTPFLSVYISSLNIPFMIVWQINLCLSVTKSVWYLIKCEGQRKPDSHFILHWMWLSLKKNYLFSSTSTTLSYRGWVVEHIVHEFGLFGLEEGIL